MARDFKIRRPLLSVERAGVRSTYPPIFHPPSFIQHPSSTIHCIQIQRQPASQPIIHTPSTAFILVSRLPVCKLSSRPTASTLTPANFLASQPASQPAWKPPDLQESRILVFLVGPQLCSYTPLAFWPASLPASLEASRHTGIQHSNHHVIKSRRGRRQRQ